MAGKKKWWLLAVVVVLAMALAVILLWDTLVMYLAPKPALTAALANAYTKLEQRFADSPAWILAKGYDENGQNTTLLQLSSSDGVQYDMQVQTDLKVNQIFAEGIVAAGGKALDVSAYLDTEFAALTSADLLRGGYYGITYDTFPVDIRSFPLLTLFLPSQTIGEWEASVSKLQAYMNRSREVPQLPDITESDMRLLILGILALKSDVGKQTVSVNGQDLACWRIAYHAGGAEVETLLGYLMDADSLAGAEISAEFFLWEKTLVKVQLSAAAGENSVFCTLELGLDAATDDLSITVAKRENGESTNLDLKISTQWEGERRDETIQLDDAVISYSWNPQTGDMGLTLPEKETILLNLSPTEKGFRIQTKDFAKLIGIESEKTFDSTMTISKGASIVTPEYKNLNEWSMEDLLILLGAAGFLLGLNLQR